MKIHRTALDQILVVESERHVDDRGFLSESFSKRAFAEATGFNGSFVQDNHSRSSRGVLRGLHYQVPPNEQGKLIQCLHGEVFDVTVDVRRSSPTFGRWAGVRLSEFESRYLWIPPGFAHGFLAMSETADVLYKITAYFAPQSERSIGWDDSTIGIVWPDVGIAPILSDKDRSAPWLSEADVFD